MARRAHACSVGLALLLAATAEGGAGGCPLADLARARERVPRPGWRGSDFAEMASVLTGKLRDAGHLVRPCEEWAVGELQDLQRRLFREAESALLETYEAARDGRRQRFASAASLEAHWAGLDAAAAAEPETLGRTRRDGLCHEAVMWWVHHLSSEAQSRLTALGLAVPSLPQRRHRPPAPAAGAAEGEVHAEYAQQVSCQQCHTGNVTGDLRDASLPPPLPVDRGRRGRERQRSCDFQNRPPCGPCEGLGGRRWGDGSEDMEPMSCEVIHGPEVAATTRGRYPSLARARLSFEAREPVAVRPEGKGRYAVFNGSLALGWQDGFMRMRYDFGGMGAEINVQTLEQARRMDPGAQASVSPKGCSCGASVAGNMHVRSFEVSDPLDPLNLPPEAGGAAYLGRVRVRLDGEGPLAGRTAVADHYAKWAFHFLVDADKASPSFGLPLRLYGPWGVRQVFHSWQLGDPSLADPDIWKLTAGCKVESPACSVFEEQGASRQFV